MGRSVVEVCTSRRPMRSLGAELRGLVKTGRSLGSAPSEGSAAAEAARAGSRRGGLARLLGLVLPHGRLRLPLGVRRKV